MKVVVKNERAGELVAAIRSGMESWLKAGEIVVQMMDEDGLTVEEIVENCPGVSDGVVRQFERIGRRMVLPELLPATYAAASRLRCLPYGDQQRLLSDGVELLTDGGDKLRVHVANLTKLQCKQVFDGEVVRDIAGQKAWIESEKTQLALRDIPKLETSYVIRKGRVYFAAGVSVDAQDLLRIVGELTK